MRIFLPLILIGAILGLSLPAAAAQRESAAGRRIAIELAFSTDGHAVPSPAEVNYQLWYKPTRCIAWISCDYDLLGRSWTMHPYHMEKGRLASVSNSSLLRIEVPAAPLSLGGNRLERISLALGNGMALELVDQAATLDQPLTPEVTLGQDGEVRIDTFTDLLKLDSTVVLNFAKARKIRIRVESTPMPPGQWERSISQRLAH